MRNLRRRYLRHLADLVCRAPWLLVLLGVVLAAVAGVYAICNLEFKTSRNDLIGRNSEYWRLFSQYAQEFRAEEDYLVVVESDDPKQNRDTIDAVRAALLSPANNPHPADQTDAQQFVASDIYSHVPLDAFEPWYLYYLTVDELHRVATAVTEFKRLVSMLQQDPRLSQFYEAMSLMLEDMSVANAAERAEIRAFIPTLSRITAGMAVVATDQSPDASESSPWAAAFFDDEVLAQVEDEMRGQGYQMFLNGRMFVALVHPRGLADAGVAHGATIAKLRRILNDVRETFPDVQISLTGEPVLDHDEMQSSQQHALRATLLTLGLIAALFAVGFHELLRPLLAVVSMVLVVVISLGYATLTVGHLNLITVTFAVMILGLGIDLGIQFIARYEEELHRGADRPGAIRTSIEQTGPSIVTAGLTNAAAFFAMGLSGFRGITELGIIAGGGMLIATVVTLLVLPALLLTVRRQTESTTIPARAAATRLEQVLLRRPRLVIAGCVATGILALSVGWRVQFDYNVLNLQSRGLESVETELRLLGADAESTIFAAVVADDLETTRDLHQQLAQLDSVAAVRSIAEIIPSEQDAKQHLIARIRESIGTVQFNVPSVAPPDADDLLRSLVKLRVRAQGLARAAAEEADETGQRVWEELVSVLRTTGDALRVLPVDVREAHLAASTDRFFTDLEDHLNLIAGQAARPMKLEDVPQDIRRMLVGRTGRYLIRVFPRENIWEREPLMTFVDEVRSIAPKATGTPLGLYEFVEILLQGYRNAALWALLVITVLILVDLRSVTGTILTVLPLLVGMVWMLGAMVLLRLPFNPANIIVLPLLVGIGVAYGIYVVQRYAEDHSAEFYRKSTGRAVILSALTTIVAFASLVLGLHRGIRSLGMVMAIGVAACLAAGLLLLPALLQLARHKGWKL